MTLIKNHLSTSGFTSLRSVEWQLKTRRWWSFSVRIRLKPHISGLWRRRRVWSSVGFVDWISSQMLIDWDARYIVVQKIYGVCWADLPWVYSNSTDFEYFLEVQGRRRASWQLIPTKLFTTDHRLRFPRIRDWFKLSLSAVRVGWAN